MAWTDRIDRRTTERT